MLRWSTASAILQIEGRFHFDSDASFGSNAEEDICELEAERQAIVAQNMAIIEKLGLQEARVKLQKLAGEKKKAAVKVQRWYVRPSGRLQSARARDRRALRHFLWAGAGGGEGAGLSFSKPLCMGLGGGGAAGVCAG